MAGKRKKWNLEKINEMGREVFGEKIGNSLEKNKKENETVEENWIRIKENMVNEAKKLIGYVKGVRKKKPWVTDAMIKKMDERRKAKRIAGEEGRRIYRRLKNELRRECEKAREKWLEEQCEEIEDMERKGRYDLAYKKIREFEKGKIESRTKNKGKSIESKEGKELTGEEALRRWKEYIEELYDKNGKPSENELAIEEEEQIKEINKGYSVIESEVRKALEEMKKGKAEGVDELPTEFLKYLNEKGVETIVSMCNRIYETGEWTEDFLATLMVPIPKKKGTIKCEEHRTISLISNCAKVFLRVLNRRLRYKMEESVGEEQMGFRKGKGTRDGIGLLRIIGERYLERGKGLCCCFVDLEKAFDRVDWIKLMDILKRRGIDWRERRLIGRLYMNQHVAVRFGNGISEWGEVGRGVRQGCCISPTLFVMYLEEIIEESLEDEENVGANIGGEWIRCLKYADDMVVIAEDPETLNRMMKKINDVCERYGMKVNKAKTKTMKIGSEERIQLEIDGVEIEQVDRFKYLGSVVESGWKCEKEIKERIGMAKAAFNKMRRILTSKMSRELRKRVMRCYVWSVFLYGSETWTLRKADMKRIQGFEMWTYRRMEGIIWTERVRNEEVLQRVGEERRLMKIVEERKKNWVGHFMRHEGILKRAVEGMVEGAVRRGRKRKKLLDELKGKEGYRELKERAISRKF